MEQKHGDGVNAMKGVSYAALAGAALAALGILAIGFYALYLSLGRTSQFFFWAGFWALVLSPVLYFLHAATLNRGLLAACGISGILGLALMFYSVLYPPGPLSDRLLPLAALCFLAVVVFLIVYRMAGDSARDHERLSLRKRT